MPDYKTAIIYKIFKDNNIYIGSTTNFNVRKNMHSSHSYYKNSLLYKTIRENGGFDTWTMEKIKDFSCNSKIELRMEEDKCIKEFGGNLNMVRAYISKEDARVKLCNYLKNKYHNDEEYKAYQLDNANNRYANDEIYRANTIHRSKQRYLKQKPVSAPSI